MTRPETCGAAGGAISLWINVIECGYGGIISSWVEGFTGSNIFCNVDKIVYVVFFSKAFTIYRGEYFTYLLTIISS